LAQALRLERSRGSSHGVVLCSACARSAAEIMKFGKQLEEYELSEWRGHYIPYNEMKKELEVVKEKANAEACAPNSPSEARIGSRLGRSLLGSHGSFSELQADASRVWDTRSPDEIWLARLETEAVRVGDFVVRGLAGIENQLQDLSRMADNLPEEAVAAVEDEDLTSETTEGGWMRLRILQAVGRVAEGVQRLRGFAELNHAALYKILKKRDKLLGGHHGLSHVYPLLVGQTKLADTKRFDSLEEELQKLSLESSSTRGLKASAEVARLVSGLGHSKGGANATGGAAALHDLVLWFFLGSSSAFLVSIGVLLWLPEKTPRTFSEAYFLTPTPVFRVVLSVLLILWCIGFVILTCDRSNINHVFILNLDPRSFVTPQYFFSRAAGLTTVWILIFGMYIVDYKWKVLPTIWSDTGYNERSSVHFLMYPVVLLLITVAGFLVPSRTCRTRYKLSVLRSMIRVMQAPCHQVDFADNLVGDILTSLAKPLQDIPAAVCYLWSEHPQPVELVERFIDKGNTCSHFTHHVVMPLIAGFPYFLRALQCARRYKDTRETRHLWNLGKYIASLLVVILSAWGTFSNTTIFIVSLVATIYAFGWDVAFDWGLGRQTLSDVADSSKERSAAVPSVELNREDITMSPKHGRVKPARRSDRAERHFSTLTYRLCSLLDLTARSTWVLTLLPVNIITANIAGRVFLVAFISSMEIIRRSMWAVLRIEYEQEANAGGFRALLWVPSKLNEQWPDATSRKNSLSAGKKPLLDPLLE